MPRSRKFALVDTGADLTLLPMSVSQALRIAVDENHPIELAGVGGGGLLAVAGDIEFELRQARESLRWHGRAHFADQDYLLLGNEGFLEFFVATFNWAAKTIELTPNAS